MASPNFYKTLQVDPEAELEVIKAAYRALSRKYHPDGSHPSAERMKQLNDAYAILKDPKARARFNDELARRADRAGERPDSSVMTPPMRYRDEPSEWQSQPRRPFRRNRFGVTTQVGLMVICLFILVISGALVPRGVDLAARSAATPTPATFQMEVSELRDSLERSGFTFEEQVDLVGEPLSAGHTESGHTLVYIGGNEQVEFVSLALTPDERLSAEEQALQQAAINTMLRSALVSGSLQTYFREWVGRTQASGSEHDGTSAGGWVMRLWRDKKADQVWLMLRPLGS